MIVSVGEDALRAVPDSYREAAIALGSEPGSRLPRAFPAAKSGLLAAVLWASVGQSVRRWSVLMATGHVQIPHSPLDPVRTLTATIASNSEKLFVGTSITGCCF